MAFDKTLLLLSADRSAQLTKALSNTGIADPLQQLCDEAEAEVLRLTTGYVIAELAMQSFIRSLAVYRAYSYAGPIPAQVKADYDSAISELEAIAGGKRPNLPKAADAGLESRAGSEGSQARVPGRMDQGTQTT